MSNMNLVLPTVSQTPGPQWASIINSDLTLIDQHDHTDNKGLPVPTAGLNINDELKFNNTTPNGLPATGLSYLGLISPQSSPVPARLFADAAGNFYYRNTAGIDVQLTVGNNPAGTPGSISGLPFGTASASYDNSTGEFIWQKATNEGATMDSGPLRLRDGSAGSNAVTITPASGTSNYTLTLPIAAPGSQSILTVASSGISTFATVNSTLTLTSSLLKVADLGIGTAQLASGSVTIPKLGSAAYNSTALSTSNFSYLGITAPTKITQLSTVVLNVTSTTRPILVTLRSCGLGTLPYKGSAVRWSSSVTLFYRAVGPSGTVDIGHCTPDSSSALPPGAFAYYFEPPAVGLYTFDTYCDVGVLVGSVDVYFESIQLFVCQS
jgi:hypothetical protein